MSKGDDVSSLNKFQIFFYNYGIYHYDSVNVAIHIICIPILTITLIRMLDYYSLFYLNSQLPYGLIFGVFVGLLYIYVDLFSGILTISMYLILESLYLKDQTPILGYAQIDFIIYLHIACWILQFIGHGVFEGRKPALMDNILLTLNAPIFVTLEILGLFNYRHKELIQTRECIKKEVERFRNSRKIKN